jgi:hypothetical protein
VNRAPQIEPVHHYAFERFRCGCAARQHRNADIGFEQFDQVTLRSNPVTVIDVETKAAKRRVEPLGMFAIIPR